MAAAPAVEVSAVEVSAAVRAPEETLEVPVPEVSEVPLSITIIITVPISVGDSVRVVITAEAADASAR